MKRCNHARGFLAHRSLAVTFRGCVGQRRLVDAKICVECGEMFSLGPSNDDSPEVQLEIALADLIAINLALWEPGRAHDQRVAIVVEYWRGVSP